MAELGPSPKTKNTFDQSEWRQRGLETGERGTPLFVVVILTPSEYLVVIRGYIYIYL